MIQLDEILFQKNRLLHNTFTLKIIINNKCKVTSVQGTMLLRSRYFNEPTFLTDQNLSTGKDIITRGKKYIKHL